MKKIIIAESNKSFESRRESIRLMFFQIIRSAALFGFPLSFATAYYLRFLNPDLSLERIVMVVAIPLIAPLFMIHFIGDYFFLKTLQIDEDLILCKAGPDSQKIRWKRLRKIGFLPTRNSNGNHLFYASTLGTAVRFEVSQTDKDRIESFVSTKLPKPG